MLILLLVRSLGGAGTEGQVALLAEALSSAKRKVKVVVFYGGGVIEKKLREKGIEVIALGKRGRWDFMGFLFRWLSLIWRCKDEEILVYSFLTGAGLVALVARFTFRNVRIFWGVRTAKKDRAFRPEDAWSTIEWRVYRFFSFIPERIIANSEAGKKFLEADGFPVEKLSTVQNAVDLNVFQYVAGSKAVLREELGVSRSTTLIGIVGRVDPIKGHEFFLRAAAEHRKINQEAHFLIIGGTRALDRLRVGSVAYKETLVCLIETLALDGYVSWLGPREDMPSVMNGLDILTSCSSSEATSNVLLEAMACGTPCVATNVGDSSVILGEVGRTVCFGDTIGLAKAWIELTNRFSGDCDQLRKTLRNHVATNYSQTLMRERTLCLIDGGRQV